MFVSDPSISQILQVLKQSGASEAIVLADLLQSVADSWEPDTGMTQKTMLRESIEELIATARSVLDNPALRQDLHS